MDIAGAICQYLKENGIKQSFVAEKCGWTKQKTSNIVRGRAKIAADDYIALCDALGVQYGFFYDAAEKTA